MWYVFVCKRFVILDELGMCSMSIVWLEIVRVLKLSVGDGCNVPWFGISTKKICQIP